MSVWRVKLRQNGEGSPAAGFFCIRSPLHFMWRAFFYFLCLYAGPGNFFGYGRLPSGRVLWRRWRNFGRLSFSAGRFFCICRKCGLKQYLCLSARDFFVSARDADGRIFPAFFEILKLFLEIFVGRNKRCMIWKNGAGG